MSQRGMSRSHSFPIAWLGFGFSVVKAVIWNSYKNIRWIEVDITRRADTLLRTICQTRADVISIHQARWTFLLSVARGFCDWSAIRCKNLAKERERERSRRGRMVIIAWRQTGGVSILRTCFNFAILSRTKESQAKAMESSTASGISCTFDPFVLLTDHTRSIS